MDRTLLQDRDAAAQPRQRELRGAARGAGRLAGHARRDLQYLRDRLNAPIVYDAFDNGYRFDGAPAGARHELPGMWFSEHEIHALLTMHQLLAGLDDDGVLARHLQPMLERLQG